ncbi:MAG: biopolymer transporter ExbD [Phycisphaeraceae bacterium]|nr:biopolymer transporter ExbD [Phycisphaeraceae bacterium]MCW5754702.1 biopolymer transporter ExbD [Phycisphaeraceae bacterium]
MKLRTRQRASTSVKINVTPMIDVVMCLIIFFLIVGTLASDRAAALDLPLARSGLDPAGDPLVINVMGSTERVEIVIDGVEVGLSGAHAAVRMALARDHAAPIIVRADRSLNMAVVRPVLTACRDAGASRIRLATEAR